MSITSCFFFQLNVSNTRREDLADLAGVKLAYRAYNRWISRHISEKALPGLDYTPKQLFWISSAIRMCSKYTPEAMSMSITSNWRSPGRYRVIGALRNLEEFADDFNCPSDTLMNAREKCDPW